MPDCLREQLGDKFHIGEYHGEIRFRTLIAELLQDRPDEEKFFMGYKAIKKIKEIFENLISSENQNSHEDNLISSENQNNHEDNLISSENQNNHEDNLIPSENQSEDNLISSENQNSHEDNLISSENQSEDNEEVILRDFLKQKSDEVKSMFLKRRDDLPVLRNRTNAELIGYEFKNLPKLQESNLSKESKNSKDDQCEEHKHVKYIEDLLEELDKYCEDIILNYQILKKYINDGYHKYFDENGNLKAANE